VAMQLDALNGCDSSDELTIQLQNLPPDLNQTYQQIFDKIDPSRRGIVLTIMQWLAFSKKALTLDQICEAVAIVIDEDKHPRFEPGKKWNRLSVEIACANLVTVMDGNGFLNIHLKKGSHRDCRKSQIGTFLC